MKRLDEISFTEVQAMQFYASLKSSQTVTYIEGAPTATPESLRWRAYADELEKSLEAKIRFALGK